MKKNSGILYKAFSNRNVIMIFTILVVFSFMSFRFPAFFTTANIEVIMMNFVQEGIMALGMTLVIISAGIDLSVGSVLGFTAALVSILLKAELGILLSILISLLVAFIIGAFNAILINVLHAHSFIITLGTMTIFRGATYVFTEGGTIGGLPYEFSFIGLDSIWGIRIPIVIFIIFSIVIGVLLKVHRFFYRVYFIGSNSKSARLSGINISVYRIIIFGICSLLAGIAGIITASQYVSANASYGVLAELRVITAVIIGGASLTGGKGTIEGTVLGVLFVALINNIFIQARLPTLWEQITYGAMLMLAVFLDKYLRSISGAGEEGWEDILLSGGSQ